MAIVKTDAAHYEGIASALRSLHEGEETYTPAEMAEYLATQGTALKPENIAEGITIFGVTGTMKYNLKDEWPPDIPPIPEFDEVVGGLDPDAPAMDKMLLMDDKGNVTVGYMYNTAVTGLMSYGGVLLPTPPADGENEYGFSAMVVTRGENGVVTSATLYRASSALYYNGFNYREFFQSVDYTGYMKVTFNPSTGVWGTPVSYASSRLHVTLSADQKVVWANHNIYGSTGGINKTPVIPSCSAPAIAPFTITAYDYRTTEFRAMGWIRISYHTTGEYAGQFTIDDFRTTESGGWNYIKNVRWSTRKSIEYMTGVWANAVWPKGVEMMNANGHIVPHINYMCPGYSYSIMLKKSSQYVLYAFRDEPIVSGNYINKPASLSYLDTRRRPVSPYSGEPSLIESADGDGSSVYHWAFENLTYVYLGSNRNYLAWSSFDIRDSNDNVIMEGSVPEVIRIPDFDFAGE